MDRMETTLTNQTTTRTVRAKVMKGRRWLLCSLSRVFLAAGLPESDTKAAAIRFRWAGAQENEAMLKCLSALSAKLPEVEVANPYIHQYVTGHVGDSPADVRVFLALLVYALNEYVRVLDLLSLDAMMNADTKRLNICSCVRRDFAKQAETLAHISV